MTTSDRNPLFTISDIDKRQLTAAAFAAILIAIPIILMVPMYLDDFLRAVTGSYKWSKDGRPLAEFIYRSMGFDSASLSLTSPLGMLLCIPGICFSSVLLCKIFRNQKIWAAALAAIFLFGQPYFLANLSFSFDSPMMVLAIFFSLCSAYLIVCVRRRKAFLASIFLQVCCLSLYQAANSAMWIPVLLAAIFPTVSNKKLQEESPLSIARVLKRPYLYLLPSLLLSQFISLAAYRFIVLNNIYLNRYARQHSALPHLIDLPFTLFTNIEDYLLRFYADWQNTNFGTVFLIFLLITSIYAVLISSRSFDFKLALHRNDLVSALSLVTSLLFVVIVFLFSYGLPLILTNPVFEPRTFIGIGVFMASISMIATRDSEFIIDTFRCGLNYNNIRNFVVFMVISAAAWACIFNLFAFSNAYSKQQKLNNYFLGSIVQEIRNKGYGNDDINIVEIIGHGPYDPSVVNTFRTLPYLRSLIRPVSDWSIGMEGKNMLMHYGFTELKNRYVVKKDVKSISSDKFFDLFTSDKSLIIKFRQPLKPKINTDS